MMPYPPKSRMILMVSILSVLFVGLCTLSTQANFLGYDGTGDGSTGPDFNEIDGSVFTAGTSFVAREFGIRISAGTSPYGRVAVYSVSGTTPVNLLYASPEILLDASGLKVIPISPSLNIVAGNKYYLCVLPKTGYVRVRLFWNGGTSHFKNTTYPTFPNPFGAPTSSAQKMYSMYLKAWTPTSTATPIWTFTPTATRTATPSRTITLTSTYSPTITPTPTVTLSPSVTPTRTHSATSTITHTPTISATFTATPTVTSTTTITFTATISATYTPSPTVSTSPTITATSSPTLFISATATPTLTASLTYSPTATATRFLSSTATPTFTTTPTLTDDALMYTGAYPVPATGDEVYFNFNFKEPTSVEIVIYNLIGEQVHKLQLDNQSIGHHSFAWNITDVAQGVYFYQMTINTASGEKLIYPVKKLLITSK